MIRKTWRLVLLLAAFVLVSAAFQRSASAFAEPCPRGYTGPASIQFGCCFSLNPPHQTTLQYYSYFCNNGFPTNSTRICSNTPCNS
jgi:hypothetical protein